MKSITETDPAIAAGLERAGNRPPAPAAEAGPVRLFAEGEVGTAAWFRIEIGGVGFGSIAVHGKAPADPVFVDFQDADKSLGRMVLDEDGWPVYYSAPDCDGAEPAVCAAHLVMIAADLEGVTRDGVLKRKPEDS